MCWALFLLEDESFTDIFGLTYMNKIIRNIDV